MSGGILGFLLAISAGTWIYLKMTKRSGNVKTSLIAAIVAGILIFIVFFTAFNSFVPHH